MKTSAWRRLKRTLLTGLFVVGPMSVTFMLLAWFVQAVDRALGPVVSFIGRPVPGLGVAAALVIVLAAGVLGSNIAGRHILEFVEELLFKVPGLNWLYRTVKQISEVFSPSAKLGGHRVVIVEYPSPGIYSIGFATGETRLDLGETQARLTAVFIPTNHMYIGNFILVPSDKVLSASLSQQEGVQALLSAGASLPQVLKTLKRSK